MPQITKGIQRLIQRSMNIDDLNSVIPYCLSEPKLKINYKQSVVHGQILHKSNMSSWGVPKCPKFIPKKYIRFTMTWMIEEHLKTTKQIWDVELHGTDSDAIWDQEQPQGNPPQTNANAWLMFCESMSIHVGPKLEAMLLSPSAECSQKTKRLIPRKTYLQYGSPKWTNPV